MNALTLTNPAAFESYCAAKFATLPADSIKRRIACFWHDAQGARWVVAIGQYNRTPCRSFRLMSEAVEFVKEYNSTLA